MVLLTISDTRVKRYMNAVRCGGMAPTKTISKQTKFKVIGYFIMTIWQINNTGFEDLLGQYASVEPDLEVTQGPIAPGKYRARLILGDLEKYRSGSTCYKITWEITDSAFTGRQIVSRSWLTPKAISRTKAELTSLGIMGEHLRGACSLPSVTAELSIVNRADEAGDLYAEVKRFRAVVQDGPDGANEATPTQEPPPEANVADSAMEGAKPNDEAVSFLDDDDLLDAEF